jgi:hypothetical protein
MSDGLQERASAQTQESQQLSEHPELRNRRSTDVLKHPHMSTARYRDSELGRVIAMQQRCKIGWQRLYDHAGSCGAPLTTEIKEHRYPDGIDVLQSRRVDQDRSIRMRRERL